MLFKYDAAGNDFLIGVDWRRERRFDAEFAEAACDRHHGVGADGLIRISEAEAGRSFRMELRNADGSVAETSGNGIRCATLCALEEGIVRPGALLVETVAGEVGATIATPSDDTGPQVRVAMGETRVQRLEHSPVEGTRAYSGEIGNPHLVLIGDSLAAIELAAIGPRLVGSVDGGQNVMAVAAAESSDELDLVPFERGSGFTLACGSGSAVAALAAHVAGIVGDKVVVHNPGGDLFVEISRLDDAFATSLTGPAERIAEVRLDEEALVVAARMRS